MKKIAFSAVALALSVVPGLAADMPVKAKKMAPVAVVSPWDFAFGGALMNDYLFRGITQSNHRPSLAVYFETRYNLNPTLQLYTGTSAESISFPNRAAAEVDYYGGIRPTFGPLALDFGAIYYTYPGGRCFNAAVPGDCAANGSLPINGSVIKANVSFWEVYGKGTWTVNDAVALGANVYYTPSYANSGANGTYASGTAKFTLPATMLPTDFGAYLSGEFGRQWLGTSDSFYGTAAFPAGIKYADYNTWNVGVGVTYKVFTLDLRYSDTDLSKGNCNALTSDFTATQTGFITPINPAPGFGSSWCGSAFVAKFSADLTSASLK
jgi:uncharacterized protein (TIGR02001 family)